MNAEEQRIRIATAEGYVGRSDKYYHDQRAWSKDGLCYATNDLPDYATDPNAIQRAVLAQDAEFQSDFDTALDNKLMKKGGWWHALTAADWCDCFCAVLDEREKK